MRHLARARTLICFDLCASGKKFFGDYSLSLAAVLPKSTQVIPYENVGHPKE